MTKKIPLSSMLRAIDRNDLTFYDRLSDEEKKEFSAWLVMRWASCSDSHAEHHLLMVNSLVNTDFSALSGHPELQWKLIAVCGIGSDTRRSWIAPPKKGKTNRVLGFLREVYPEAKGDDLEQLFSMLDKKDIENLAKSYGMSDKEIKELKK